MRGMVSESSSSAGLQAGVSGLRPSPLRAWVLAARPHTLGVTLSPVLIGCMLAWQERGRWQAGLALVTLLAAVLIQIGTNLLNDVGDFERGADQPGRLGPERATAMGWLAPGQVRRAGMGALALALMLGVWLAWYGGWPIVLIGTVSLLCGWAYTAGPKPIAYGPFGEIFVWVFFGLAAVLGSYYLQAGAPSAGAWVLGHMMGALAAAVMLVNNTRDAVLDARAGKRTLAVRIGLAASRWLYAALLLLPFVLLPAVGQTSGMPLLALPLAAWLAWCFARQAPGRGHNVLLARTAQLQLLFAVLWCIGQWLAV